MENIELNQLDQQIAELNSRRQAIVDAHRNQALEQARALIRQYGFGAHELGLSLKLKAAPVRAEPRYANPAEPSQTWPGGKGKRPGWVRAHLDAGGQMDDLLIKR